MYKGLYDKFSNWFRGGNIWLYSDPHFGDEEMKYIRKNYIGDEEQIKRINSKVGKNDTIIFLGDIGDVECVKKIRGYKVLIMGNHDKGATNYKREISTEFRSEYITEMDKILLENSMITRDSEGVKEIIAKYTKVNDNHLFDEIYEGPLMISDKILLSHEPVRYIEPYIWFNIHGHDHANWFPKFEGDPYMNVCAEWIDYTPVSLLSMLKNGTFSKVENIHRLTIDNATAKKGGKKNE